MTMHDRMTYPEILGALKRQGVPEAAAERAAADEIARQAAIERPTASDWRAVLAHSGAKRATIEAERGAEAPVVDGNSQSRTLVRVGADRFAVCEAKLDRQHDVLVATFELPPRTSKNSRRFLFRHSAAYARFNDAIVEAVKPALKDLALPLPDQAYNLAATFYVDKPGERADLFGLLQGLADVLQHAGIVSNDWHFRTVDGSHVVTGDERPRVELTIQPIEA